MRRFIVLMFPLAVVLGECRTALAAESRQDVKPQCSHYAVEFCCKLLGVPLIMRDILELLPPKAEGASLWEQKVILEKIGLRAEGYELGPEELLSGPFPMIVHTHSDHFLVVEHADKNGVSTLEGRARRVVRPYEDFLEMWDGKALIVQRPEKQRPLPAFIKRPRGQACLQFEKRFIDAGDVARNGESVNFEFPFHNLGTGDLEIRKVHTTCSCTMVPEIPEKPVPPGGKGKIVVKYDAGNRRGGFGYLVYVESNDPTFPVISLNIAGNTHQRLHIKPGTLEFLNVVAGEKVTSRCFVRYTGDAPVRLSSPMTDVNGLTVTCKPILPEELRVTVSDPNSRVLQQHLYVLDVQVDTGALGGEGTTGTLRFQTNLAKYPKIEIPVTVKVVPPVVARPSLIYLGDVWVGKPISAEVSLVSMNGQAFRIKSVDMGDTGLQCTFDQGCTTCARMEFKGTVNPENNLGGRVIPVSVLNPESTESHEIHLPISAFPKTDSLLVAEKGR